MATGKLKLVSTIPGNPTLQPHRTMIELNSNALTFSFQTVHPSAALTIDFQRTLRIPDNDQSYPLPPGTGRFTLRHVDDFASRLRKEWIERGGVMLPMYQSEAMWIHFSSAHDSARQTDYPFAVKIAAGKINAVTGQAWTSLLHREPQDYIVTPPQPWLDGFSLSKGEIRQFVAMPLGDGYTAEEQISDSSDIGGIQIVVYPMKRVVYERRFRKQSRVVEQLLERQTVRFARELSSGEGRQAAMGLAAGGRMQQDIYDDPYSADDWDLTQSARCFVHILNSRMWSDITGEKNPNEPRTAADYSRAGLPWFDYYDESATALEGSPILGGLKSVASMWKEKNRESLPDNSHVATERVVELRRGLRRNQVREGSF